MAIQITAEVREAFRQLPSSLQMLQDLQQTVEARKDSYCSQLDQKQARRAENYLNASVWHQRWMRSTFCPFKKMPSWWPLALQKRSLVIGWARRTEAEKLEGKLIELQAAYSPLTSALSDRRLVRSSSIELTQENIEFLRASYQLTIVSTKKSRVIRDIYDQSCALVKIDPEFEAESERLLQRVTRHSHKFEHAIRRYRSHFPSIYLFDVPLFFSGASSSSSDYEYNYAKPPRHDNNHEKKLDDAYAYFGLDRTVTRQAVNGTYKRLALKWHPDRNRGDKAAEAEFQKLGEHYGLIKDYLDELEAQTQRRAAATEQSSPGKNFYGTFRPSPAAKFEAAEEACHYASAPTA